MLQLRAGLRALTLSRNRFASLPESLALATALSSLVVSDNWQLRLSTADFQILSQLPRLRHFVAEQVSGAQPAFLWVLEEWRPAVKVYFSLRT